MTTPRSGRFDVREIAESELDALLDLYQHLHESDDPLPPRAALDAIWKELCGDPRYVYLGVFEAGVLVASCTVTIIPNLTRGARPYGVVENVVTRADRRQRGHGRAVVQAAIDRCRDRACYKVMLLSGANRAEVHAFYERIGFDKHAKQGFLVRL